MKILRTDRGGLSNRQGWFELPFRSNRVRSANLPYCFVALILLLTSGIVAQEIPDELAIAKAKFQKTTDAFAKAKPTELNKKYAGGVEKLQEQVQAEGDLEGLLELKKELETLEKTGAPPTEDAKNEGLQKLREIYETANRSWKNGQVDQFEKAKASYIGTLKGLTSTVLKAGRVDDAVMIREEAVAVGEMTIVDIWGQDTSEKPAEMAVTGQGRVQGFGWLCRRNPGDGDLIDFSAVQKYDDYVEVKGNHLAIFFRRANGDVLDHTGKVVGQGAVNLQVAERFGSYMDAEGDVHGFFESQGLKETGPYKKLLKTWGRFIAIDQNDNLLWWGDEYDDGRRPQPPERARTGVKDIACYWDKDFVLLKSGELISFNKHGEAEVKEPIKSNTKFLAMNVRHGFVLGNDNKVYHLGAGVPDFANFPTKYIVLGGDFWAFLKEDGLWDVYNKNRQPRGNVEEVLETVLNRPGTIDTTFNLSNGAKDNHQTACYAVWIEEPGAAPIDFEAPEKTVITPTSTSSTSGGSSSRGSGFFGIQID